MKYAGIIEDDVVNGQGVCVSFWTQGCPFHCKGCHNSLTWDFSGGLDADQDQLTEEILTLLSKNGIQRNFSILGGEPLCSQNRPFVHHLISAVRENYPNIKIFLWTGYEKEELKQQQDPLLTDIFKNVDIIVTGRFILEQRDVSLPLRGSSNQQILHRGIDF